MNEVTCSEINSIHTLAERSLFETESLIALLLRLKGIKKIHEESPNIEKEVEGINSTTATITQMNNDNKSELETVKADISKQFDNILKDLEQCEQDISALS